MGDSLNKKMVSWYRATCFGRPIGPWRKSVRYAREDLIAEGLGSHDEYGCFFVTVPGGMDRQSEWMPYDDAVALASSVKSSNPAHHRESLPIANLDRTMRLVRRSRD